jgi:methionyl-tRNA formyltransferase
MWRTVHPELTLYAMTAKGIATFAALQAAYPGLVRQVVSARDAGVDDDSYERLAKACADAGVPFHDRGAAAALPATGHALAVGWRWIIPVADETTLVVFHDSLLPRHRGFNPLVTALVSGDEATGVTALLAAAEYDRGDILAQVTVPLVRPIRIADAIDLVAVAYATLAERIGGLIAAGTPLAGVPQDEAAATYSLWRDDEDYEVDWSLAAERIRDFVYAVGPPYAGARTSVGGEVVRLLDVTVEEDVRIANRTPGKVIFLRDGKPTVVCGSGLLRIDAMDLDGSPGTSALPVRRFRSRFRPALPLRTDENGR